jgi:hypothetical protein
MAAPLDQRGLAELEDPPEYVKRLIETCIRNHLFPRRSMELVRLKIKYIWTSITFDQSLVAHPVHPCFSSLDMPRVFLVAVQARSNSEHLWRDCFNYLLRHVFRPNRMLDCMLRIKNTDLDLGYGPYRIYREGRWINYLLGQSQRDFFSARRSALIMELQEHQPEETKRWNEHTKRLLEERLQDLAEN